MHHPGRPPKYSPIIAVLEDKTLYSAASIACFATSFLTADANACLARRRLRIAMGRMRQNKGLLFPHGGDGQVHQTGRPAVAGWFGWRWKRAYNINHKELE